MRDIKFRGKGVADDEWYYGDLIQSCLGTAWIITEDYTTATEDITLNTCASPQIKQNTLGQYTGLHDKNEKEIYEGDILLAPVWFGSLKCVCIYQQENQVSSIQGFGLYSYDTYFQKYRTLVESDEWDEFEVIGNIYDNPDLLEKGAEE